MKIAIIKLSALGDIVHAMVALQYIKKKYPNAIIDWVVEAGFADVLVGNPDIDRILPIRLKSLKQNKLNIFPEIKKIRHYAGRHYDYVIDAQGLIKSALTARLLSSNTVGFDKHSVREPLATLLYQSTVSYPYDGNTIDRNVAVIARPLGMNITEQQIHNKAPFLFYTEAPILKPYFVTDKVNILFAIGSTWESRNYPKQQYLQVIEQLAENSLLIWGNEQEKQAAEWIASQTEYATVLPKLNFNQLKAALSQSDLVIGNDTGPTHMAWGLNRPSITLFGPTPVSRVYQTKMNKVLKSPSIVNPFKLNKKDFSITEINVNDVIKLARALLKND